MRRLLPLLAALALPAAAQAPDTLRLDAVEVTAAPFALAPDRAPFALAVRQRGAVELATDPGTALDAVARGLPGLWISDRGNPSTGERVLVRGLGWRAAFGVRGTHVLLDGVPLTLADGQGQLNVIEPALVDRVEVLRGPASTFWGSGSAGVLAVSTTQSGPRVRARALGGAYGLAKGEIAVRPDAGDRARVLAWGSALSQRGFREQASNEAYRGGATAAVDLGDGQTLGLVGLGAFVPRAESPGGITADQAADDPRQVRDVSISQDARKRLAQGHLAASYSRPAFGDARVRITANAAGRTLDNPIVPRYITLDRVSGSLRAVIERTRPDAIGWAVGIEQEAQRDDRLERDNDGGQPGTTVLTDQVETVLANAAFGQLSVPLTPALIATVGGRVDLLAYRADPADGPAETIRLSAASPSVGLAYRTRGATVYANAAGALDAPTTTELGNRADGASGFNPDLSPERTWGGEVGVRASRPVAGGRVGLDAAVFAAVARDLLLPVEIDDVTFFRNEGRARHRGVELALSADGVRLGPGQFDGAVALTAASGEFLSGPADSETPEGNRVPGFPPRLATWTATWTASGPLALAVGIDGEAAAAYAADSANELETDAYAVVHLRLALVGVAIGSARATPFVTVRNVGDAAYAGSVVVNAFGGRFVEPAPGRHLAAGVSVTLP
ncbi:TonB-dependent receptor [Rubrivirga sp. IMCC43871]|uniref:TonB-dependent receptor n=1 Tax=Rubrivirga sp. IMCC43871 TaxID=3391575 RepID=UPI00398FA2AA